MSRHDPPSERTIYRALVVDAHHPDADWADYLRARSRADDGRDPAADTHTSAPPTTDEPREVAP